MPAMLGRWGRSWRDRATADLPVDRFRFSPLPLSYHLSMFAAPVDSTVLSFEDARRAVEQQAALILSSMAAGGGTESVELLAAAGGVLAEGVAADRDFPPFPRSTRDGYAVRSADLSQLPAMLEVVGEVKAGEMIEKIPVIGSGQAAAIMTGAPVPAGADAVVMVEYGSPHNSQLGKQVE